MILPKEILEKVKAKTGESDEVIEEIFKAKASFIVKVIRQGKFEGIKIMNFGKFYVDRKRLEKIKEKLDAAANTERS